MDTAKQPTNAKTVTNPGSLAATQNVPNNMEARMTTIPFLDLVPCPLLLLIIFPSIISAHGMTSKGILAITTTIIAIRDAVVITPVDGICASRSLFMFGKRCKKNTPMIM